MTSCLLIFFVFVIFSGFFSVFEINYCCKVFFIAVVIADAIVVSIADVLVIAEAVFLIGFKLKFLSFRCLSFCHYFSTLIYTVVLLFLEECFISVSENIRTFFDNYSSL